MTNAEQAWCNDITELGCIVCLLFARVRTPGAVHHLLTKGGRRIGHLATICLCDPGHHQNSPTRRKVSRHPTKARFEAAYGTEQSLLAKSRELVARMRASQGRT